VRRATRRNVDDRASGYGGLGPAAAGGGGHAIICSPEEILLESRRPGVFTVTVDLVRLQWLRHEMDRRVDSMPWRTKPGIFKQWLRPELCRGMYGSS
jgi:hypothetical protein